MNWNKDGGKNMAVEPESYGLNETQTLKRKACIIGVKRARNGNWKVLVDVEIEVRLPDGRLVIAWQEVSLRGRGEPKPHPDPKWLYEGKQGRARSRKKR
jgi:hypothetical protein